MSFASLPSPASAKDLPVSTPTLPVPAGACDCHAHVFGPYERFPLPPSRSYTPPEATADDFQDLLDRLGFERAVLVQASAYTSDHACLLEAIGRRPDRRRGVGVVRADVSDAELARLRAGGVRGMRFTQMIHPVTKQQPEGASTFADLEGLAPRLREHGFHAELFTTLDNFLAAGPRLLDLGLPLVLDHMGRIGPGGRTIDDPGFQRLLGLLREGRVWLKMVVFRNTRALWPYDGVRPFHDAVVAANPDHLVWGSDWPLLSMAERTPDIGKLVDLLGDWVSDPTLTRRILVDNAARRYDLPPLT